MHKKGKRMKNSKTKKDDIGVKVGSFKVEVELTWKQLAEMREKEIKSLRVQLDTYKFQANAAVQANGHSMQRIDELHKVIQTIVRSLHEVQTKRSEEHTSELQSLRHLV